MCPYQSRSFLCFFEVFSKFHSVVFCSFKDPYEGRLREMHQDTHQSRMVSPAVILDQTLSGFVWIPVDWDMGPATIT